MGVDNSMRVDHFCSKFRVEVNRLTEDEMEFDMIGIDPAIANSFRRILLAEVGLAMSLCSRNEMIYVPFASLLSDWSASR